MEVVQNCGTPSARNDNGQHQGDRNSVGSGAATTATTTAVASSLSQRIELLDSETRSCWRRVDELEDEEASLNHRFIRLEKIRRGERLEILSLEQACKAEEVAMLQAEEEAANLDAMSQVLESLAEDAAAADDDENAAAFEAQQSTDDNNGNKTSSRVEGSATLVAALNDMSGHEEKRKQLSSMLQHTEYHTRSEIAEAARSAAELRRSAKKRDGECLSLEHETTALRKELAEMTGEAEIQARMGRAIQIGKGLERRLKHASSKLASVRESLAQGAAKHMEEEEQQSLELMQSIAEAKARLRSHGTVSEPTPWSGSTNRGRGSRVSSSTPVSSQPRLQMQPSRGGASRKSHQTSGRHNWGGGWS